MGEVNLLKFLVIFYQKLFKCYKNNIKFKIFQQCLENQIKDIKKLYNENNINFKLFSFSENLFRALSCRFSNY